MKHLRLILTCLALTFPLLTKAVERASFRYGMEWGVNSAILVGSHSSYISGEGYLVDSRSLDLRSHINGEVMGLIGLEYKRLGLYIRSGYMGLQKGESVVPVLLRSSFALSRSGVEKHGSIYIEGGCGLQKSKPVSAVTGTGYVYRLRLSEKLALDMNGGLRISYSHPDVYDKYAERKVPKESLGLSNSLNIGLALTIALVF
mgnify:FL=1